MAAGPEDILQMQIARFLKVAAPDLVWFHPANGGFRNVREAVKLRDMGVRPGVADMCFVLPGGLAGFIELKTPTGRVEKTQKAFAAEVIAAGAAYALCRSLDDVAATLTGWGVKLKATPQ